MKTTKQCLIHYITIHVLAQYTKMQTFNISVSFLTVSPHFGLIVFVGWLDPLFRLFITIAADPAGSGLLHPVFQGGSKQSSNRLDYKKSSLDHGLELGLNVSLALRTN